MLSLSLVQGHVIYSVGLKEESLDKKMMIPSLSLLSPFLLLLLVGIINCAPRSFHTARGQIRCPFLRSFAKSVLFSFGFEAALLPRPD